MSATAVTEPSKVGESVVLPAAKIPENTPIPEGSSNVLEGVNVNKPENAVTKTRKYLCAIKDETPFGTLDFQIGVGPVVFCRRTFTWEGQGDDATRAAIRGAVYDLTDAQVEEVRSKLRFRYLRPSSMKTPEGRVMTGVEDVDASDSDPKNPRLIPGRLRGDEVPLRDILVFERVHTVTGLKNASISLAEARRIVEEAEKDNDRDLEGPDAIFEMEQGKGGKSMTVEKRDAKTQKSLTTVTHKTGKGEANAGLIT